MDAAWLTAKRWYGAADRELRSLAVVEREQVAPTLEWQVVEARFASGEPAFYQVFWDEEAGEDRADHPAALRWLAPQLEVTSSRLLSGEQSNTSIVSEPGPVVVKIFRRLTAERNPDAVVVRRLWEIGFRGVPEPVFERCRPILALEGYTGPNGAGMAEGNAAPGAGAGNGGGVDLAVGRRFLLGSADGWDLAIAATSGFAREAAELGRLTADMHLALVRALGSEPLDTRRTAEAMSADGRRVLGDDAPTWVFEQMARADGGVAIRPHGDYHLGQVLRHEGSWYVLDFEGEPARPVAERMRPSSPLRDVAGMLRSFAYAVAVAGHSPDWELECRAGFLDAYLTTSGIEQLLPPEYQLLLDAFELDKAIYEVAYEKSHRPDWVGIPMAAINRLAGQPR